MRHPPATRQEARDRLLGLSRKPEAGGVLRLARLNPVVTLVAALATGFLMAASLSFRNLGYALLGRLLTKIL